MFIPSNVFTFTSVPQIWRLVTSFCLSYGGLDIIFAPYFCKGIQGEVFESIVNVKQVWDYGSQLEVNSPHFAQPGDFLVYVVFVSVVILVSR